VNQGKKKAEIHANRCQNGVMHKGFKIKRDVTPYLTSSYVMEVFFYISMFNPFDCFSANRSKISEFDTLMGLGNDRHKYICGLCVARTLKALMLYNCVFTLKWWEKFKKLPVFKIAGMLQERLI